MCLVKLLPFDYEIVYKKGKDNIVADALSRVTSGEFCVTTLFAVTSDLLQEVQQSWTTDQNLQNIIVDLQSNAASYPSYSWTQQLLRRKGKLVVGSNVALWTKLLTLYHASPLAGHIGMHAILHNLQSLFY